MDEVVVVQYICVVHRGGTEWVQEAAVPVWSYWDMSFNSVTTGLLLTPRNWISMNHFHLRSVLFIYAPVNLWSISTVVLHWIGV